MSSLFETEQLPENLCPEMAEYIDWYFKEWRGRIEKLRKHIATCPECMELMRQSKDYVGFEMLRMSDEELRDLFEKGKKDN